MQLTSQQVKDMLHVGDTRLAKLIEEGRLVPTNSPREGAKKFFRKFDSAAIKKLAAEMKANGEVNGHGPRTAKPAETSPSPLGIISRLERIEREIGELKQSVAQLLKVWS